MGNFSRDTFDPSKRYLGVRLQQGVPLVDADWNEQNDAIRHETYSGLHTLTSHVNKVVVFGSSLVFRVTSLWLNPQNNFYIWGGNALHKGKPIYKSAWAYNNQPLRDANLANEWGVDPIPDLTTPGSDRTDTIYLDIWEREIDSDEDTDLVNPVIGVETAVRLKREVAVRVAEDSSYPPAAPDGHEYVAIGYLDREGGNADINNDMIRDNRILAKAIPGSYNINIPPIFNSYAFYDFWRNHTGYAYKSGGSTVGGLIPLDVPEGAKISYLRVRGRMTGINTGTTRVYTRLYRVATNWVSGSWLGQPEYIASDDFENSANISRYMYVTEEEHKYVSTEYAYFIYAYAWGPGYIYLNNFNLQYSV